MSQLELIASITEENKRRKRKRIVLTAMYVESVCLALAYVSTQRAPRSLGCFSDEEQRYGLRKYLLKEMYNGSEVTCYDELRLTKRNFHDLCAMLREKCGLVDSIYVTVEEKVAMFLLVVGHGLKMRLLRGTYKRSLETISRHFSSVLTAILSLSGEFIKLPDPSIEPPDDYKWKWFGNALGALDGCHVDVSVVPADQGRYRNRKQDISTNMLGVVDWNMKFLYVLPGWEGSASDSRVLRDAMRNDRQDAFVIPQGKYYLVDAGYTNGPGFLAPFRSTRYHLKEWVSSQQQPQNPKELYNLRHSRARNVVERTFGLWKKKWAILRIQSFFDIKDQANKKEKSLPSYKTKVVKNWEAISTIYSKDHADGEGARTGVETAADLEEPIEISPEEKPKRQRTGDAIMCMIGDMRTTFNDALKTTDPLPLPKVTTPSEILAALQLIPELAEADMLRSYGKLILNERLFEALLELPMHMRKAWLLLLP